MTLLPPLIVVILILIVVPSQKLLACYTKSKDPHTSTLNLAFTEHITNALIQAREEKLRVEASIPRKLEDGWDPMIKIKLNNFSCYDLCDVGASTSVMPKRMYDIFDLKHFDPCSFGVRRVDSSVKKPLGKIDDVLIIV